MRTTGSQRAVPDAKRKLLDAAMQLMLRQGYTATTVDQVCGEAGLTKGSFFHYFKSKEQIGQAAIDHFSSCQRDANAQASFNRNQDPLEKVLGMLDFFASNASDPGNPRACLVGNLAQELAQTNPRIRSRCEERFKQWTADVAALLTAAKATHPPTADFDPDSLATMILSTVQGSLLVAKTLQDPQVLVQNARHTRAYLMSLFGVTQR